jgi:hypothetical protein
MIDRHTAVISGFGDSVRTPDSVLRKTLLCAAQLTLSKHYRYFAVISADDASLNTSIILPSVTKSVTNAVATGSIMNGDFSAQGASETQSVSLPALSIPVSAPGVRIVIDMMDNNSPRADSRRIWDAQSIIAAAQ